MTAKNTLIIIIIILFTTTLTACGGGGNDTEILQATVLPSNGSTISHKDSITITFNDPVNTSSCKLGGYMAGESDGGQWISSDTLRLKPSSINGWTPGISRSLSVDVNDLNGTPITQINLSYNIVKLAIYVSSHENAVYGNGGDDGNVGSQEAPKATINAAIADLAATGFTGDVYVAQGNYEVEYQAGTHIQLVEGISLYGGYSRTNWSVRDPEIYITTILDTSATGGIVYKENRVIYAGSGITDLTVVDGFNIIGGSGEGSSGFFVEDGGAPIIQNNTINGGNGLYTYGILNTNLSSSTIQANDINGGNGGYFSTGILNDSSSPIIWRNNISGGSGGISSDGISNMYSSPVVESNNIYGGDGGDTSYALFNYSSSPILINNIINGGVGRSESNGIYNVSASPFIANNSISGGSSGGETKGIVNHLSSLPRVENNIIFTANTGSFNYCFFEGFNPLDPVTFRNNNLFNCSSGLYYDEKATAITDIASVNGLTDTIASGNISIDPIFADIDGLDNDISTINDNDWHLTASSPSTVTTGAIDGGPHGENWGFTLDMDGVSRTGDNTTGWSMGAFEYDAP